jgi:putative iron-regulated protein
MPVVKGLTLALIALLVGSGCSEPEPPPPPPSPTPSVVATPADAEQLAQAERFREAGSELLQAVANCTQTLDTKGTDFLTLLDDDSLQPLKTQWHTCQQLYQASTALIAFSPEHQQQMQAARNNLGLPLTMPGFIDSVREYPYSGIVNDASLPLDETSLREQHGVTDESEVSLGLEVVAFLIWGEQYFDQALTPRPISDFEPVSSWDDSTTDLPIEEHPNNRRRRLLALCLHLLTTDSQALLAIWQSAELPATNTAMAQWQNKQRGELVAALGNEPPNSALLEHIQSWLADNAIPGVEQIAAEAAPAATTEDPAQTAAQLRQQLRPAEPHPDSTKQGSTKQG